MYPSDLLRCLGLSAALMSISTHGYAQSYQRLDSRDYEDRERSEQRYYERDREQEDSRSDPHCKNALKQASRASERLADAARKLRMCAESRQFNDDCSGEFRRTTNTHSDYDEAVSMVRRQCR